MLSQIKEGKIYLEDMDDHIELDLTETNVSSGFFTETCFVLALGILVENVFKVKELAHPPSESMEMNRALHGTSQLFGGNPDLEDRVGFYLFKSFFLVCSSSGEIYNT